MLLQAVARNLGMLGGGGSDGWLASFLVVGSRAKLEDLLGAWLVVSVERYEGRRGAWGPVRRALGTSLRMESSNAEGAFQSLQGRAESSVDLGLMLAVWGQRHAAPHMVLRGANHLWTVPTVPL